MKIIKVCEGRGVVKKTGSKKRNTIDMRRILGSRWTSVEIREGHRQYECSETRGSKSNQNLELRMSNCCGPEERRVHLWIPHEELRDKSVWRQGWTTLKEIKQANRGALVDARICFLCKGMKVVECDECHGTGKVGLQQVLYD